MDGVAEVGVVLSPFQNEMFHALRGGGAFCNDLPIAFSSTTAVCDALIATGFPYERDELDGLCGRLQRVLSKCRDMRRNGAASIDFCWVACGRIDGFYEQGLHPWDGAAGKVIVREAGGVIAHFPYDPHQRRGSTRFTHDLFIDNVVACAPGILDELQGLLAG
jgi:myo-inositol-1(or 4)-monophosphatase